MPEKIPVPEKRNSEGRTAYMYIFYYKGNSIKTTKTSQQSLQNTINGKNIFVLLKNSNIRYPTEINFLYHVKSE